MDSRTGAPKSPLALDISASTFLGLRPRLFFSLESSRTLIFVVLLLSDGFSEDFSFSGSSDILFDFDELPEILLGETLSFIGLASCLAKIPDTLVANCVEALPDLRLLDNKESSISLTVASFFSSFSSTTGRVEIFVVVLLPRFCLEVFVDFLFDVLVVDKLIDLSGVS